MNHFMKYEHSADNNVEKKVLNEFVPTVANKQLAGALGRSQKKFGTGVQDDIFKVQKAAAALYQNLKELLANDPDAEAKKLRIVKLVYNWTKAQPLVQQQQQQQQVGQPQQQQPPVQ